MHSRSNDCIVFSVRSDRGIESSFEWDHGTSQRTEMRIPCKRKHMEIRGLGFESRTKGRETNQVRGLIVSLAESDEVDGYKLQKVYPEYERTIHTRDLLSQKKLQLMN